MTTTLSPLREGRITASRVSGVLGLNPHATPEQVMREMVRQHFDEPEEFTGNFLTEWGKAHEMDAVAAWENENDKVATAVGDDQVTHVHPLYDFLAATPDGEVDDDGLLEVKCPRMGRYIHLSDRPDHRSQIQLQLACTEREWCDHVIWRPDPDTVGGKIDTSTVLRDLSWLQSNLPALREFHDRYLTIIDDEELAAPYRHPLIDIRTDDEWYAAECDYVDLLVAKDGLEKAMAEQKAKLIGLAGDERSTRGPALLLTRTAGSGGGVSYKAALEHYAPGADLTPFTSSGSSSEPTWTVRRNSEKKKK